MGLKKLASGELESLVTEVLWDLGRPLTPGEVHRALDEVRPLAYTTVMTILVRLWEKGQLTRERRGRAYSYAPVQTREARTAARMQELLGAAGDPNAALVRFIEGLTDEHRSELRRVLGSRVTNR